jgi:hypothetical protein
MPTVFASLLPVPMNFASPAGIDAVDLPGQSLEGK